MPAGRDPTRIHYSERASRATSFHEVFDAMTANPSWLPLNEIEPWVPLMRAWGVSTVARGPRGFLPAYRRARGQQDAMRSASPRGRRESWWQRRNAFVARHMAQVKASGESLWLPNGYPTRRHLALIAWAYSPHRVKLRNLLRA